VAGSFGIGTGSLSGSALIPWVFISIPIVWGVYRTLIVAIDIFK